MDSYLKRMAKGTAQTQLTNVLLGNKVSVKSAMKAQAASMVVNKVFQKGSEVMHNSSQRGHQHQGYPPQNSAYPASGGNPYPQQAGYSPQAPGYPPQSGYPPQAQGYPPQNPGYPPQNQGYPPQNQGYPPQNQGYPPQNQGYPPQNQGYPPQNQSYPSQNPGYPPQNPGYPPQPSSGYPSQSAPYPSNPGFPTPQASPFSAGQPYASAPGQPTPYPPGGQSLPYPVAPMSAPSLGSESTPYPVGQPNPFPPAEQRSTSTWQGPGVLSIQEIPSIKPMALFDPSSDAAALRKAMKGFGTDEKAIINILARRTSYQRQEILMRYSQSYGKDLIKDLKSELSGNFEQVIIAMMTPIPKYLAQEVHNAMQGIGTNERTLVEILCTRDNASLHQIKQAYQHLYKKPIQDDIRGDTSGDFKRLLISMCTAFREEGPANPALAPGLAQQLYKAGEGKVGTNETEFNRILSTYSFPMLRCVFEEYQKIKGKSFGDAIKSELSGDLKLGMMAIYSAIQNRAGFFAKEIHDSMSGMGTKDNTLVRLVITRSEIDMVNIKEEYQKMYKTTVEKDIKGDTSGDYQKVLLALVES